MVKTMEREASRRRSEPEGSRLMLCLLAAASFTIFSSAATTGAPITTATYHPPEPAGSGSSGEESAAALYSWNNNNSNPDCCGGLIVEGCAQYPGGPTCWGSPPNATVPSGSYGWIVLGFKANHTADCPAIPADGIGSVLGKDTPLYPVSLKEALNQDGQPLCALACNISEVERTGIDPCNKGTIAAHAPLPAWLLPPVQKTGSPEQLPGPVNMSCYWGGMGWMKDPTMGMCGYNATMRSPQTGGFCQTVNGPPEGCPDLAIDPRRFPCCGGSARCDEDGEEDTRPLCCSCKQE